MNKAKFFRTSLITLINSIDSDNASILEYLYYFTKGKLESTGIKTETEKEDVICKNDIITDIIDIDDLEQLNYIKTIVSDILNEEEGGAING